MSREIKFRAWEKNPEDDVAHFIYNVVVGENVSYHVLGNSGFVQKMNNDDFVIEQYTGLIDKNGKEIYEGDIVNVDGQRCVMRAFVRPALIESGFALFDSQIRQKELRERSADTAEVIGNIHENKELLGGGE